MSSSSKRERQLRKERARLQRTGRTRAGSGEANMKFLCPTCGARIEQPGNIMIGDVQLTNHDTGEVTSVPMDGKWETKCPVCGRTASATNQVRVERDGHTVTGFADTPEQFQKIIDSIEELKQLHEDASLEEVLEVLDRRPDLRPVASWVREHSDLILGVTAVAGVLQTVIALLTFLGVSLGPDSEPQPSPAPGHH